MGLKNNLNFFPQKFLFPKYSSYICNIINKHHNNNIMTNITVQTFKISYTDEKNNNVVEYTQLHRDDYRRFLPDFTEEITDTILTLKYEVSKDPDNPGHCIFFEHGDDNHLIGMDSKEEVLELLELLEDMVISSEEFIEIIEPYRYTNQMLCCPWHMQSSSRLTFFN